MTNDGWAGGRKPRFHEAAFGEHVDALVAGCGSGRICGLMFSMRTPLTFFSASTWISLSKWPMLQTIAWSYHRQHVRGGDDGRSCQSW